LGGVFGLTNLPFDVGRISGEAMRSTINLAMRVREKY